MWTQTKEDAVLQRHSISPCAWNLLSQLSLRDTREPDALAEYLVQYHSRDSFGKSAYAHAINESISRKWCMVLTQDDVMAIAEARMTRTIPQLHDWVESRIGVVDFTQEGFDLTRTMTEEIFGSEHVRFNDSGWNQDDILARVDIYAPTENVCQERIQDLKETPASYLGEGVILTDIASPHAIGPWSPLRFITLPAGFHATVFYSRRSEGGSPTTPRTVQ